MADDHPPDFVRIDAQRGVLRLVPVASEAHATHLSLRRIQEREDTYRRLLTAAQAQVHDLHERLAALEAQRRAQVSRLTDAEERARGHRQDVHTLTLAVRHLKEKNVEIAGEKRRLRDMLTKKVAIPALARRIMIGQDDTAFFIESVPLDTFPDWEHRRAALTEARRLLSPHGTRKARLREVRLDRVVWRALITIIIDEEPTPRP